MLDFQDELNKLEIAFIDRIKRYSSLSLIEQRNLAATLDFFNELSAAGYGGFIERVKLDYAQIVKDLISKKTEGVSSISLNELNILINTDADVILRSGEAYSSQFKSRMLKGLLYGETTKEMLTDYRTPEFKYNWDITAFNTAQDEFHAVATAKVFEDDPEQKFKLEHPIDDRTRPQCLAAHKYQPEDGFTIKQVNSGLLTDIVKAHYHEFTKRVIKDEQLEYTWRMRGRFNCRGRFEPV